MSRDVAEHVYYIVQVVVSMATVAGLVLALVLATEKAKGKRRD